MPTIERLLQETYGNWDDASILSRVGQELQGHSRLAEARDVLARAVALDPSDLDAWANLAYAHYRDLDQDGGHAVLRRGIEATDSDTLRATLCNFCGEEEATPIRAALEGTQDVGAMTILLGQRFWQGDHAPSLEEIRRLVAENPDHAIAREQLLWTLLGARKRGVLEGLDLHLDGLPQVDARILAAPDAMDGWWMKMQMLHAEKDWDGLLETTAAALERFPDEETVMLFRARAFRKNGDEDRAAAWFLRAIGAKPSFAGARVELGRLYEKQGRLDLAEEIFREIPAANPAYPMGSMSLVLFLARHERWDEAEAVFLPVWPQMPAMFQAAFQQIPEAKVILERDAVRAAVEA